MGMLVSIIVPCYNQAHFLDESLNSVLNQTYSNWECIIVNDGSPDNTEQVAKKWCKKDKRFQYLKKENGGLSSARNVGIKISKGEYILPLDADDIIHESLVEKMVPELNNNLDLAIVTPYSKFFAGNVSNITYELKPEGSSYRSMLFENNIIATSLYRKQCWIEVGGYDEQMKSGFEDWEFWIAILKQGWKFKVIKEFLFYYRKQEKSMLIDTLQNHRITNMEYVFNKHKEIYKDNFDVTLKYMFYLLKLYENKNKNLQKTKEYKLGKAIINPFKKLKNK
jgi:glycosyltransferase involved in cell wall biosynthesis